MLGVLHLLTFLAYLLLYCVHFFVIGARYNSLFFRELSFCEVFFIHFRN
jgi:hypothetical protein